MVPFKNSGTRGLFCPQTAFLILSGFKNWVVIGMPSSGPWILGPIWNDLPIFMI